MILATMLLANSALVLPVTGNQFWEELPYVQLKKGYHPKLRFNSWEIIRYNRSTTYMFETPAFVQQGQFEVHDGHYTFHALMANELENADIARLQGGMDAQAARKLGDGYAKSMSNFEADYNDNDKILRVAYPVDGRMARFELHAITEGDDQLTMTASNDERGVIGLWHANDPFPEKLDAYTRYKIGGLEGLQQYAREAGGSDGSQLGVMDLRADRSFRLHKDIGTWEKSGSTITLVLGREKTNFTLSADGTKLLQSGKPAYLRN